jgi:hypothetical protein
MLRVPLVASLCGPGYWLEFFVVLGVVAAVDGKLSPSSWAPTWTDGWYEPRVRVGGYDHERGVLPRLA